MMQLIRFQIHLSLVQVFNDHKKQRSNSGFTLIEMTISILVIGIVSGLSLMIFSEATENYFSGTSSKKLLDDTRATFWRLSQEIRDIDDNQQITSSRQISFIPTLLHQIKAWRLLQMTFL